MVAYSRTRNPSSIMINILIADDHEIFIQALVSLLDDSGEIHVLATASNGQSALRLVEEHSDVDVLVLDISMPVMDGVEALTELRRRNCAIPVLMLTQESSGGTIARATKAGAAGYVLKTAGRDEFMTAIRTVASGGQYMSEEAKTSLIVRLSGRKTPGEGIPLSPREHEVLKLVAAGKTTNEIGEALFISPFTAETHRRNLLKKLHIKNTAGLVRYAIEHGFASE
jgi:two-component system, NarL family, nitrate/nitrite response regulator NarL